MLTVHNGRKAVPVSTHGKTLINELMSPKNARLDIILNCIEKDNLAGRLKDPKTGNNSYHILLGIIVNFMIFISLDIRRCIHVFVCIFVNRGVHISLHSYVST
jgi:hypothetical protein